MLFFNTQETHHKTIYTHTSLLGVTYQLYSILTGRDMSSSVSLFWSAVSLSDRRLGCFKKLFCLSYRPPEPASGFVLIMHLSSSTAIWFQELRGTCSTCSTGTTIFLWMFHTSRACRTTQHDMLWYFYASKVSHMWEIPNPLLEQWITLLKCLTQSKGIISDFCIIKCHPPFSFVDPYFL